MDVARQQFLAAESGGAVAGAETTSKDGEEEQPLEDEVWRERHLLMAVINNLRVVADAALDRAETAEEAAKAAERSEAAAVQRCRAAESAQTMQSSIEARIRDSVVAEVHEAVRAASEEATVELRAAAAEIRRLRAGPHDLSGMNSAGFELEAEAEAPFVRTMSADELHRSRYFQSSTASAGMVLRPADQEGRDVQPPLMASQGVPRPKTDPLGHIRANLDTLFALVQEPSVESLGRDSAAPPSHRASSASTRKNSFHTLEKSASETGLEEGQDATTTAQTLRMAKVPQCQNRVQRIQTEPLRVSCQQEFALSKPHGCPTKKVRDFVSKLERQREFQQSSLERSDQQCLDASVSVHSAPGGGDEEKCARSMQATLAEPYKGMRRSMEARHLSLGSKHGISKAPGCRPTAKRASV